MLGVPPRVAGPAQPLCRLPCEGWVGLTCGGGVAGGGIPLPPERLLAEQVLQDLFVLRQAQQRLLRQHGRLRVAVAQGGEEQEGLEAAHGHHLVAKHNKGRKKG